MPLFLCIKDVQWMPADLRFILNHKKIRQEFDISQNPKESTILFGQFKT